MLVDVFCRFEGKLSLVTWLCARECKMHAHTIFTATAINAAQHCLYSLEAAMSHISTRCHDRLPSTD